MVTEAFFIKQICATEMPPSLGQIMCFVLQSQVQQRFEGCRYFPLTETKETPLKLFFSLCVCVCARKLQVLEQNKLKLRANQHSVLEVSSKEATQSVVWTWHCSLWFWDTFLRKTRVLPQNVVSIPTSLQLTADMQNLGSWPGQGIVIFHWIL